MAKRKRRSKPKKSFQLPKNYQDKKYIPYIMRVEIGIIQIATADSGLTDGDVKQALRQLIKQLRLAGAPATPFKAAVVENIRLKSSDKFSPLILTNLLDTLPDNVPLLLEDAIGILDEVKSSIGVWSYDPGGQAYLDYLRGFLADVGLTIKQTPTEKGDEK